jgi:hypothetical protein
MLAFRRAYSEKEAMMAPLRAARVMIARHYVMFRLFALPRECNKVADFCSKRAFMRAECEARLIFGPECEITWRRRQ